MRKMRTSILAGVLSASVALAAEAPVYAAAQPIWLEINQTYYLNTGAQIERVAVGNPSIADVRILGASAVNVVAFAVGSTALTVWTKDGMRQEFNIVVSASDSGMADMIEKAINMPNVKVKKVGDKILLLRMHFINQRFKGNVVKVHVGDSSKQSFNEQLIGVFRRLGIAVRCTGKTDQSTGKLILQSGDIRLFPADTGFRTALATCSLFTLKTKHLSIQLHFLLMLLR